MASLSSNLDERVWQYLSSSDPAEVSKANIRPEDWPELLKRGFTAQDLFSKCNNVRKSARIPIGGIGRSKVYLSYCYETNIGGIAVKVGTLQYFVEIKGDSREGVKSVSAEAIFCLWKFICMSMSKGFTYDNRSFRIEAITYPRSEALPRRDRVIFEAVNDFLTWRLGFMEPPLESLTLSNTFVPSSWFEKLLQVFHLSFYNCWFDAPNENFVCCDQTTEWINFFYTRSATSMAHFLKIATKIKEVDGILYSGVHGIEPIVKALATNSGETMAVLTMRGCKEEGRDDPSDEIRLVVDVISSFPNLHDLNLYCLNPNKDASLPWEDYALEIERSLSHQFSLTDLQLGSSGCRFWCYESKARSYYKSKVRSLIHRNIRLKELIRVCQVIVTSDDKQKLLRPLLENCQDSPIFIFEIVSRCINPLIAFLSASRPSKKARLSL